MSPVHMGPSFIAAPAFSLGSSYRESLSSGSGPFAADSTPHAINWDGGTIQANGTDISVESTDIVINTPGRYFAVVKAAVLLESATTGGLIRVYHVTPPGFSFTVEQQIVQAIGGGELFVLYTTETAPFAASDRITFSFACFADGASPTITLETARVYVQRVA